MIPLLSPWQALRAGLLADLGFESAAELAEAISYSDVDDVRRALDGEPPGDELMSALLRYYLILPPLYFVERSAA